MQPCKREAVIALRATPLKQSSVKSSALRLRRFSFGNNHGLKTIGHSHLKRMIITDALHCYK